MELIKIGEKISENMIGNHILSKTNDSIKNNLSETESSETESLENSSLDINELIEGIKFKISNLEKIDEKIIEQIHSSLKKIQKDHNNKIDYWYDNKYYSDVNIFKENNIEFSKLTDFYYKNSFVIIEK
jgi:hypothetical protein